MASRFSKQLAFSFFFLGLAACTSPEAPFYEGKDLPAAYLKIIQELELVPEGEEIHFFYTDGMLKIQEGIYLATDRHLIIYSEEMQEARNTIHFKDIAKLEIQYDDSVWEDSLILLETRNGKKFSFPVTSEKMRDKKFYDYLKSKTVLD